MAYGGHSRIPCVSSQQVVERQLARKGTFKHDVPTWSLCHGPFSVMPRISPFNVIQQAWPGFDIGQGYPLFGGFKGESSRNKTPNHKGRVQAPTKNTNNNKKSKTSIEHARTITTSKWRMEEKRRRMEEDGGKMEEDGGNMKEEGGKMEEDGGKMEEDAGKMDEDGGKMEETWRRMEEKWRRNGGG